jgi:phosphoribosyl 1,2-cyclic phosphate phosphodiesterase
VLGCACPCCRSADTRDQRTRSSAFVRIPGGSHILIDPTTDFRCHALRSKIQTVQTVLVTHALPDRISGFDDLRVFNRISLFASPASAADLFRHFPYAFGGPVLQKGGGVPALTLIAVDSTFEVNSITVDPIPLNKGEVIKYGYRLGNFAYLSDGNHLNDQAYEKLAGVELLVVSAVGPKKSRNHFSFSDAIAIIENIRPRRAWLTYISHCVTHAAAEAWVADAMSERPGLAGIEILVAYDKLIIKGIRLGSLMHDS